MRCDDATMLVSAKADGEPIDSDGLELHLQGCPSCQAFEATTNHIRRSLRLSDVPSGIDRAESVLGRIDEQTGRRRSERRYPLRAIAAALLVVALTSIGAFAAGRASSNATSIEATASQAGSSDTPAVSSSAGQASLQSLTSGHLVVIWNQDSLDPTIVPHLEALGVATTVVRRGTVYLEASHDSSGRLVDDLEDGWTIPLDAVAIDPATYQSVTQFASIPELQPGEAVLSETSAGLRGLDVGATIDIAGTSLRVVAIVPDLSVGAAEVAVSYNTGAAIGLTSERYVLAVTALDTADYADLLPNGLHTPVRIHDQAASPWLRNNDAVLPQLTIKTLFGEFATRPAGEEFEVDPDWAAENLVTAEIAGVGILTCHRLIIPMLEHAIELAGPSAVESTAGCWNPRGVRATGDLSRHSWGIAIDLTTSDQALIDALVSEGLTSGESWLTPDPDHFEFTSATSIQP